MLAASRLLGWIWAGIALLLLAALAYAGFHERLERALEDWTGETDFRQQVEGLLLQMRPRQANTADMVPVANAGVNPYGVNTFFEQEVEEWKLRRSMEMLRTAGVRWVRQQMPWFDIEIPSKGKYVTSDGTSTWDKYDRFISLAREYGLNIVARLDAPPNWSRVDNSVYNRPPDDLRDYGDFVYAFVKRYRGQIKYYQIWNEPNIYPEWGDRPVDAYEYAELLKVGYRRAKEADPEAVVLCAALAPTLGTPDGMNESDLTFLQKMYDAGVKDYFDIMSVMGYGLWSGPGNRRTDPTQANFSRPLLIREIMVRNGDAGKAIWAAEVGWNALPLDFPGPATHGRVTEEQQARYMVQAYRRAQAEWPWMGVLFCWHFRMVSDESRNQVVFYFRMVDPDFTTHAVYGAYRELATRPPLLGRGYHQEDHWALKYQGGWETKHNADAVLGGYRVSRAAGDSLTFRFQGTHLTLVTASGTAQGRLYVEIDGSPYWADQLARDEQGRAYVDLQNRGDAWRVEVPLAAGLRPGSHQATLTVGGPGSGVIDGIIVDSVPRLWGPLLGIVLVLGLAAALMACRFICGGKACQIASTSRSSTAAKHPISSRSSGAP
ncbi:MAG: hypothetical protein ABIH46_08545 [Chloroflexota bacterium]